MGVEIRLVKWEDRWFKLLYQVNETTVYFYLFIFLKKLTVMNILSFPYIIITIQCLTKVL